MTSILQNFLNLGLNVQHDVMLRECKDSPRWGEIPLRSNYAAESPHREVKDILLRFNTISQDVTKAFDDCESIAYPAWHEFDYIRGVALDLMRYVEGVRIGRVMLTRLPHSGRIHPHADQGAPAHYYERYHVVVGCGHGPNRFRIGDEWVDTRPGEVWWVNNSIEHEVVNESGEDRIHLIVDVREEL